MPVIVSNRLRRTRLRLPVLKRLAERVVRAVGQTRAELSLVLVGDRHMRQLNRQYRSRDYLTDVLAFPLAPSHPSPIRGGGLGRGVRHASRVAPGPLGDVVISLPRAARQAAEAGHSLEHEVVTLLIHGALHLVGYDHERSAREAARMRRKERAIFRSLGRIPKLTRK